MLAGIALYLLCADNEEGAEIYGAAMDRDQARKVYDVAARMVRLSPVLSKRLTVRDSAKRIVDEQTASYYEAIPADAGGNLGHNPHGIVFDEILTQKNGDLWDALRTGMGTRTQPLMVAATTPGNDPAGWCGQMHLEMERVAEDPERAPHILVFLRNLPMDSDPFDESNWAWPNPALGDFLSMQAIRDEAIEARNDPAKENAYRQFRMASVGRLHRGTVAKTVAGQGTVIGSFGLVWPGPRGEVGPYSVVHPHTGGCDCGERRSAATQRGAPGRDGEDARPVEVLDP